MAFATLFTLGVFSFPLLTFAQSNGFVFPPTAGPDVAIVGDSHLTFEIGETINLEWATNSTSLLSLIAFQGPRDPPDRGVYNLTLIDRAPAPVPTSYVWTVRPLNENDSGFRLSPIHFMVWSWGDGIGFNSKYVEVTPASGASTTSASSSSAPSFTSSDSSFSSPEPSSSNGKIGYKIGLGIGIPLAFVIGGIACFLILRRNRRRAAQSTADTIITETPEVEGREVKPKDPVQHEADGIPRHEMA